MDAGALHSALQRARQLAASEAGCSELRTLLRSLNPSREFCRGHAGQPQRVPVRRARAAELLEAVEGEAALALRRLPGGRCAYREAELAHHAAASTAAAAASGALDAAAAAAGLVALRSGVLALRAHPGVYLLPGALSLQQQEGLVRASLRAFIERPNRRNLDAFADPDASNVAWAARHGQGSSDLQPKRGAAAAVAQAGGFATGLWPAFVASCSGSSSSSSSGSSSGTPLAIDALTWATLGLQYDWTQRAYHLPQDPDYAAHAHSSSGAAEGHDARWRAPFPRSLQALCQGLVASLAAAVEAGLQAGLLSGAGSGADVAAAWGLPMTLHAQAAIVNVYRGEAKLKLPMGGHSDNMERTMRKPVVSLSLGCPCLFLVGGATKEVAPTPLLLRSGDVLVLSGASRAAYHGVPRVFEAEGAGLFEGSAGDVGPALQRWGDGDGLGDGPAHVGSAEEEAAFRRFITGARLNINVRQVVDEPVDA